MPASWPGDGVEEDVYTGHGPQPPHPKPRQMQACTHTHTHTLHRNMALELIYEPLSKQLLTLPSTPLYVRFEGSEKECKDEVRVLSGQR